uniref:Metalloendopeptidase n=1 Tax=Heterololigo bleekeri TaxID=1423826 RepID=Q8IU47_HETBL|nr:myosinase-I [Heterololigo bleekeri]
MRGAVIWVVFFWIGCVRAVPLDTEPDDIPDGFDPRYPEEVPGLFEGDIELNSNRFRRSVVGDPKRRWPIKKIPMHIYSHFAQSDIDVILESLREIEDDIRVDGKDCLTFVNKTEDEEIYIYVAKGVGCRSNIGYKGRNQGVKLGVGCRVKGIIIHEVLHSLGFYHEHSRPDRDEFVKIMFDNIKEKDKNNFLKLMPPEINTQGLPYDYNSIMHYEESSFAIDRFKPTIVPLKKNVNIGQRIGMSQLDIVQLQRFYGCPERKLVPVITEDTVSINCTFDAGYCGWTHIFMDPPVKKNTWIRWSGITETEGTGPRTDHTFGTFEGHYLSTEASLRFGSVAKIQTPELKPGDHCLKFWYHMYGKDMGSIRVNLLYGKKVQSLMFIQGNQGNKWKEMKISLTAPSDPSKIEFVSITGYYVKSDIAIDDVLLLDGKC